jgi:hypothetical protein
MKVDSEHYSLTNLLLVGVLLSYGASAEKARILFEIYDDSCCHSLDYDTVIRMVEDIYQVTVLQLPVLATHCAGPSLILGYIEQIKYRAERGKEKLVCAFLDGRLSLPQEAFIEYLTSTPNVTLLFTWGIRDFMFKVYKQIPSTRHIKATADRPTPYAQRSSLKKSRSKSANRVRFVEGVVTSTLVLSASESDVNSA